MEILKADYRSPEAPEIFTRSLQTTGFGVVTAHPIAKELIEAVYADWKQVFASDAKFDFVFDKADQSGYFPFKSENAKGYNVKDLKEFFHIFPRNLNAIYVSENTKKLQSELLSLGSTLLSWIDQSAPEPVRKLFSMPLSQMFKDSPQNLFRIIHYPPLEGAEEKDAVRAAAHEDINLITLLPAASEMGLQVKDRSGKWFEVEGNFGDIVVNVGDMLQEASGGYYVSTTHQVVNPQGEAARKPRYSMPLFIHPRSEVRLSQKFTAGEYLDERLREIGLK